MDHINNSGSAATETASPHEPGRHGFSGLLILQISIILLTGIVAYCNSLNGPFHFDDLGISDKSYLWPRAFNSGPRQLADLTFVLNHLLHGEHVFGYHLINIAVHLAAAVTLYCLVFSALTALSVSFPCPAAKNSSESQFIRRFIPFATAILFVCHPVQTQAVSYIVQRYTAMAALFYFGSVLVFIRARIAAILHHKRLRIWTLSLLSILLGVLAMRCKESAYTLPIMLIMVELFLFRGGLMKSRAFVAGMAILLLAIPVSLIAQHGIGGLGDLLYNLQHSTKEELTYSRSDYLLTQFRVVVSYLRLLLLPINQNLDYDIPLQKSFFSGPVIASAVLHLTIIISSAMLFIRSRRLLSHGYSEQGACLRLTSFGIIWFYLALSIESSIIPILDVMFEHRLYLPSGGAFLVITASAAVLAASRRSLQTAAWVVLAAVCCLLTFATIQRNRVWNDDLLLWEDTARKSPNKPRVLANLAAAYLRDGKPEKALPPLIRAIELAPGLTDPLNYLGSILDLLRKYEGRYDNGRRFIVGTRNVDMRYYNAWFANTRNNLGLLYEHSGNFAMAIQCYQAAASLAPTFELAWYNLFLAATRQQDRQLAADAFEKLNMLNPERARAALLQAETHN